MLKHMGGASISVWAELNKNYYPKINYNIKMKFYLPIKDKI